MEIRVCARKERERLLQTYVRTYVHPDPPTCCTCVVQTHTYTYSSNVSKEEQMKSLSYMHVSQLAMTIGIELAS